MPFLRQKLEQEKYDSFLLENGRNSLQTKTWVVQVIFFTLSSLSLKINNYTMYYIGIDFIFYGSFSVYAYKNGLPFGLGIERPNLPEYQKERRSDYLLGKLFLVLSPFFIIYALDLPLFYPIWERDVSWDAFTDVLYRETHQGKR